MSPKLFVQNKKKDATIIEEKTKKNNGHEIEEKNRVHGGRQEMSGVQI